MAAVEPDGLERLMAGDTPDAAAVAGHLAGCPSCAAELVRIRRTSAVVREIVRSEPDPELRDRTLAFVKAVGRDRTGEAVEGVEPVTTAVPAPATIAVLPAAGPAPVGAPVAVASRRPARRGLALLGIAAAVVIAVGVGYAAGGASERANTTATENELAILSDAAVTATQIQSTPDAQRVALTATAAEPGAQGTLLVLRDERGAGRRRHGPHGGRPERGVRLLGRGQRPARAPRPHVLGRRRLDLGGTGAGPRRARSRRDVRRLADPRRRQPRRARPDREPLGTLGRARYGDAAAPDWGSRAPAATSGGRSANASQRDSGACRGRRGHRGSRRRGGAPVGRLRTSWTIASSWSGSTSTSGGGKPR